MRTDPGLCYHNPTPLSTYTATTTQFMNSQTLLACADVQDVVDEKLLELNEQFSGMVQNLDDQLKKQTQPIKGLRNEIASGQEDDGQVFVQIVSGPH